MNPLELQIHIRKKKIETLSKIINIEANYGRARVQFTIYK